MLLHTHTLYNMYANTHIPNIPISVKGCVRFWMHSGLLTNVILMDTWFYLFRIKHHAAVSIFVFLSGYFWR